MVLPSIDEFSLTVGDGLGGTSDGDGCDRRRSGRRRLRDVNGGGSGGIPRVLIVLKDGVMIKVMEVGVGVGVGVGGGCGASAVSDPRSPSLNASFEFAFALFLEDELLGMSECFSLFAALDDVHGIGLVPSVFGCGS